MKLISNTKNDDENNTNVYLFIFSSTYPKFGYKNNATLANKRGEDNQKFTHTITFIFHASKLQAIFPTHKTLSNIGGDLNMIISERAQNSIPSRKELWHIKGSKHRFDFDKKVYLLSSE